MKQNKITKTKISVYNRTFNTIVDAYVYKILFKYGYAERVHINKKIKILDEFQYRLETVTPVYVKVNFVVYDEAGKYMILIFTKKSPEQKETAREKIIKKFLQAYLIKIGENPIILNINSKTSAKLLIDILNK